MQSWRELISGRELARLEEKLRPYFASLRAYCLPRSRNLIASLRAYRLPRSRKLISSALMLAGVILLFYVGSQYWGMYDRQKQLAAEWERQAARANVAGQASLSSQDQLTRVIIKKIGLDAIVVEGASRKQLSEGPGHMKQTAMPGEPGNAVITGHRDTFFRHIYELNKGDEIIVRRAGQVFRFQVTGKRVVYPEDVSVLRPTSEPQLTLITCYPTYYIGPAPKRLVVFSRLVDSNADFYKQAAAP